jgi:hypothetical protein
MRLSAARKAVICSALLCGAALCLYVCLTFPLLQILLSRDSGFEFFVRADSTCLAVLVFACWWAGDLWRRLVKIFLIIAYATLVSAGMGVLIGTAFGNWRLLWTPFAFNAALCSLAGLGCWYLASKIKINPLAIA